MENFSHPHNFNSSQSAHLNPHYHLPPAQHTLHQQPPTDLMSRNHPELRPRYPQDDQSNQMLPPDPEDGMPGASDFVRKLFRMLEDPAFASIVCWGSQRDCFIVKDMTEFTKVILPRLFKHSNFASFVRQLNKYDFHKVKNTDENAYGEHCWTFRHPKFRADHLDGLEDIKRKSAPTRRTSTRATHSTQSKSPVESPAHHRDVGGVPSTSGGPTTTVASTSSADASLVSVLQSQIDQLLQSQQDMKSHIYTLESNYRSVLDEMAAFQQGMASQDALIQNLLQHLVNFEQPKRPGDPASNPNGQPIESNFVSEEAQRMLSTSAYNPQDVARASLQQLTELSRRANRSSIPMGPVPPPSLSTSSVPPQLTALPRLQTSADLGGGSAAPQNISSPSTRGPTGGVQSPIDWSNHQGLQVLTVGHLLPRSSSASGPTADDMEIEEQVLPSASYQSQTPVSATPTSSASPNRLRVRRKTYVPGWAVPPRVLLVEDDAVSRKLSSKFLQVLGVTADVAVDGDAAVKQMCLERYDLVLMDIVMPRLDGVAATSLIRQFDHRTPIISMTSNSCPQDILNYYSHGMNDILPKPFTRDGLFSMLEKHLNHLKAMSQLSQIPRNLGPGDGEQRIKEVDANGNYKQEEPNRSLMPPTPSTSSPFPPTTFISGTPSTSFGSVNPMAGLGVGDEQQYAAMLANMTGDLFSDRTIGMKRPAETAEPDSLDEHQAKRGRFEAVE
ncbi:hypothetical protein M408DRAFT_138020 [Serendipita vermifera MAFF 305830]|uniref:Transcription factor n=1 Tax=Serendipita vermifera MAFF 305830 TaxID=933852 RepID=A0A0C3B9A5_SERVB|nr:hypothetical protein M408DRAFT_138020 [Serendipita vermifera MAFF 305830]